MPPVPAAITNEIAGLRKAVRASVPKRTEGNLLIGSWNLRAFGDLTEKWNAGPNDSPKRDWRSVALIAELVSHFDVFAVQEVRRNTTALRFLMERLGPTWRFITSDVTEGDAGNGERLTFLHDSERVQPSGLVGEIVLPDEVDTPAKQFARSPYAASFATRGVEFVLTTVHVIWGKNAAARVPELSAFAEWMRAWADRKDDWNQNLFVLGDFNIDRLDDPLYQAFVSTGLFTPGDLNAVPRTIFDDDKSHHFYDQIAWFWDTDSPVLADVLSGLRYASAGSVDFVPHAFAGLTKNELSWRISDHFPLWVELHVG